jgi:hypothetical protein
MLTAPTQSIFGAPGNLASEQAAFHEAAGACNRESGMALGRLYVPLTVSRKLRAQGKIDDNIRACSYYPLELVSAGRIPTQTPGVEQLVEAPGLSPGWPPRANAGPATGVC